MSARDVDRQATEDKLRSGITQAMRAVASKYNLEFLADNMDDTSAGRGPDRRNTDRWTFLGLTQDNPKLKRVLILKIVALFGPRPNPVFHISSSVGSDVQGTGYNAQAYFKYPADKAVVLTASELMNNGVFDENKFSQYITEMLHKMVNEQHHCKKIQIGIFSSLPRGMWDAWDSLSAAASARCRGQVRNLSQLKPG